MVSAGGEMLFSIDERVACRCDSLRYQGLFGSTWALKITGGPCKRTTESLSRGLRKDKFDESWVEYGLSSPRQGSSNPTFYSFLAARGFVTLYCSVPPNCTPRSDLCTVWSRNAAASAVTVMHDRLCLYPSQTFHEYHLGQHMVLR